MINSIDQIGHKITLSAIPKRIVSLVPSQTELLYHLGLDEEVVGITKFCVHPKHWFKNKTRVGGTKTLKLDVIQGLEPDLIIANKEENTAEQIQFLQNKFNVYTSDITTLENSFEMIHDLGSLLSCELKSSQLIQEIQVNFEQLDQLNTRDRKILYLIWQKPFMSVGSDTFIHDLLTRCGLTNVMESKTRYPELTIEGIQQLKPDIVFLSSEPFPFSEEHVATFQKLLPEARIELVDGEYFSWYGSRLIDASNYFIELLNKIT